MTLRSTARAPQAGTGRLPRVSPLENLDQIEDDDLAALYAYPADLDRPWVRANFVSTLDGAASGQDGRSGSINNDADKRVFGLLRSLADVILVGAGTARAEGYRPVRTREVWRDLRARIGLAPAPVLAVVTRSLDVPAGVLEQVEGGGPVLVVSSHRADAAKVADLTATLGADAVIRAGEDAVDLANVLEQLGERGLSRVLCEGGPSLMSDLVAAQRLDELCLTLSPQLIGGDGPRITTGGPLDLDLRLGHVVESEGVLLTRWLRE